MPRSFVLLVLFGLLTQGPSYAQGGIRDTTISIVPITMTYAYQLPYGDMGLRFGANHNVGLSVGKKFKNNYYLGAEGSFLFGNKVNESSILNALITEEGAIVDQSGQQATVLLYERGYTALITVGKIIPIVGPNPNSGLFLKLGGGYMRHKIRIETQDAEVMALEGDYLKGYDRLTAGPMAMVSVGYQHFGNRRLVNFYLGWEMNLGFTESLRPFNFDTGRDASGRRSDGLNGLRVGWTLPIYKRRDDRIFYN
jgi:hypothetical protein